MSSGAPAPARDATIQLATEEIDTEEGRGDACLRPAAAQITEFTFAGTLQEYRAGHEPLAPMAPHIQPISEGG